VPRRQATRREEVTKVCYIAGVIALIPSAASLSGASMIENGQDHRHDPKFKAAKKSSGSN
jgi:hypothetical protein